MKKNVYISFASPSISVKDHVEDFREAVKWASHNLALRHKIELIDHGVENDFMYKIELIVPETFENFNAGRHLRGISRWLIIKRPEYYTSYKVGIRLLNYRVEDLSCHILQLP